VSSDAIYVLLLLFLLISMILNKQRVLLNVHRSLITCFVWIMSGLADHV